MEFVLYCLDQPNGAEIRGNVRVSHLDYVSQRQQAFRFGGPLFDERGAVKGSLMIISAADRAALQRHMDGDPFFASGLFESVTVWTSRQVLPEVVPGALAREAEEARAGALRQT